MPILWIHFIRNETEVITWSNDNNNKKDDATHGRYHQQRYQQTAPVLRFRSHKFLTQIQKRNEYTEQ